MFARVLARDGCFRPIGALINPRAQEANLLCSKRVLFLRHAVKIRFSTENGLDEQTVSAFARDEQRARIAAFQSSRLLIQAKAAFLLFSAVALVARRREKRLDVTCKRDFVRSSSPGGSRAEKQGHTDCANVYQR